MLIGLITGLFSGLFGIGGGVVCTPLLRLVLAADAHIAVGTTIALIIPTSMSGAINFLRQESINKKLAKSVVLPAVLGVLAGAALTNMVNGHTLMILFAVLVGLSGLDISFGILQKLIARISGKEDVEHTEFPISVKKAMPLGLLAGFLAGFFGVGGGFILVPC